MPKAFDTGEKEAIRGALMAIGLKHFARVGVRAVRVDDICREAGIAKGSFYAFFPSKEELFMQIAEAREAIHRQDMLDFTESSVGGAAARAGGFFDMLVAKIETDPVLAIAIGHGEIAHLARKLGPERMQEGARSDHAFVAEIARRWPGRPLDAEVLLGFMTILLSLVTARQGMTGEQYRPALGLLRELFIDRLVGGRK